MHVKDQNKNDKAKRLDWSFKFLIDLSKII
jgi:hypothetical protein